MTARAAGQGQATAQTGSSVSESTCVQASRISHPTIVMLLPGLSLCLFGLVFR